MIKRKRVDFRKEEESPNILILIQKLWIEKTKLEIERRGRRGSVTIGDGFEFEYEGEAYFMPTPPFQRSIPYEAFREDIKKELKRIGAKNIVYNFGRMD